MKLSQALQSAAIIVVDGVAQRVTHADLECVNSPDEILIFTTIEECGTEQGYAYSTLEQELSEGKLEIYSLHRVPVEQ